LWLFEDLEREMSQIKLAGKELVWVLEGLQLDCIVGGIEKEHGCLFADFSLETDIGFN
jgi:hypothetical protein